jgi:hypothetical protein
VHEGCSELGAASLKNPLDSCDWSLSIPPLGPPLHGPCSSGTKVENGHLKKVHSLNSHQGAPGVLVKAIISCLWRSTSGWLSFNLIGWNPKSYISFCYICWIYMRSTSERAIQESKRIRHRGRQAWCPQKDFSCSQESWSCIRELRECTTCMFMGECQQVNIMDATLSKDKTMIWLSRLKLWIEEHIFRSRTWISHKNQTYIDN